MKNYNFLMSKKYFVTFGSKDFKKPKAIRGNVITFGIIKCLRSIKKIIKKDKNKIQKNKVVNEIPNRKYINVNDNKLKISTIRYWKAIL